ncbi:MAG: DUF2808 domain-containing protein [Snowella sp.]|nr:DUF2808 domain-containing protein [Snowella sp.]
MISLRKRFTLSSRWLLSLLAISSCLVAAVPTLTLAGGNSGLTIFSGVERKDILEYFLQFNGLPNQRDRYKLYIPSKKLTQGASKFFISYPKNFDGLFRTDSIEIRLKDKSVPLKSVIWDKESRFLEITPEEAIPPNTKVEIVLSNVTNPDMGTYYFVADALASGDIPVRLYLGTWIISISRS